MKFYPHHIADYASATAHLSNEEDICYRRLLDRYYDTEQPLENDIRLLSRHCRVSADAVRAVLDDFFSLVDGRWHNARANAEISKWYDKCAKAKQAIEARWSKRNSDTDVLRTNIERNTRRYELDTTQDPIPNTETPIPTASKKRIPRESTSSAVAAVRFDAQQYLVEHGAEQQTAADYLAVRKAKKAAPTRTALGAIVAEAGKAAMSLETALTICCARGWAGFKAGWVADDNAARAGPRRPEKFDPVAYVNRNRTPQHEHASGKIIDITGERLA